jgi:hypothetical protein
VYELFALALGLPADAMRQGASHGPSWFVNIAHYPKQAWTLPVLNLSCFHH